jgi:hypothetical protein
MEFGEVPGSSIEECHWQLAASAVAHDTGGQAASGTRLEVTPPCLGASACHGQAQRRHAVWF